MIEKEIEEFLEYFKDSELPNPEHEPIRFAYYVRMFRYWKSKQNADTV